MTNPTISSIVVLALLVGACTSRSVPETFPPDTAVSPDASPGLQARPVAFTEDPAMKAEEVAVHDHAGATETPASSAKYSCPMHPEVVSDEPGSCSICGMHLEPLK